MAEERSGAKDLVLAPGEYAFIADDTKGLVDVCVGPYKMSLANTERPVVFSAKSKRFESAMLEDRQLSTIAPEGWYVVLKNPASQNRHPTPAQRGSLPELNVGRKINIRGPASFALWPGQMAAVLKGHNLRSNQYLLVRVYDEDGARAEWKNQVMKPQSPTPPTGSEVAPGTGGELAGAALPGVRTPITTQDDRGATQMAPPPPPDLTIGKMLIIKGTEVSFYIPPTGIEVVRDGEGELVREAVTLESLEYCVLLDENGKKRTEHGPAVVFPEPTEVFVQKRQHEAAEGEDPGKEPVLARKFRAIELNEHSGVYVKVIAPYTDDTGEHPDGEELFITGKERKFYFPREEHAIVKYGDRKVHYATAIPAGEGRYVLNRDTGDIRIERGPAMLLPDPRRDVVCRRALDLKLVGLLYPGNTEALAFNSSLIGQQPTPDAANAALAGAVATAMFASANYGGGGRSELIASHGLMDTAEGRGIRKAGRGFAGEAITRPHGYTEPRTIMLNTRYQGVVTIDVWTGYAIKLVRPTGESRVVIGPKTALLEYDEQPQVLSLSKGTPKTHDAPIKTVYLCIAANRVSDVVHVETSDLVGIDLHVSYRVNFVGDSNKWFAVDNYVRVLCDRARSELRRAAIAVSVEQFYYQAAEIVRAAVLGDTQDLADAPPGMEFPENGMRVYDVEVSKVEVQADVKQLLVSSQQASIRERMEMEAARRKLDHETIMQDVRRRMGDEVNKTNAHSADIAKQEIERKSAMELQRTAALAAEEEASAKIKLDSVVAKGKEQELYLAQRKREWDAEHLTRQQTQELHLEEVKAEVQAIVDKAKAITPGLVEALNSFGERAMVEKVAQAMAPMSLIGAGSVMEVLGRMLEGTKLGKQLKTVANGASEAAVATNSDA